MFWVFELFWGVTALELVLWLLPSLRLQRIVSPVVMIAVTGASGTLLVSHLSLPTFIVLLMSAYRVCNLFRLMKGRINEKHLRRKTLQASLWLIGLQAATLGLWGIAARLHISTYHLWLVILYLDLTGSIVVASSALRHLLKTQPPKVPEQPIADNQLPSVTVCIPARNETADLEACLNTLVASDYLKLEILVLDDCSQNRRTPEIIRTFAHAGVRFLQGKEPEENWLAKNQAYQQLLEEANGELVIFCGVDVRFAPGSVRQLVTAMIRKKKSMISIIPKNVLPRSGDTLGSMLLQPMRYAWELALPRKLFRRPPVLSTCWIAKHELLTSAGGFAAVSRSIVPESYFARISTVQDGYSFMQSNQLIGIVTGKSVAEQRATTIRMRYPQLHRRLEFVLLLTLVELCGILLPYGLVLEAIFGHLSAQLTILSVTVIVLQTYTYVGMVTLTYRRWRGLALVLLPLVAVVDVSLLNYSMVLYEFFSVVWKGRNVCIPVMRVEPTI